MLTDGFWIETKALQIYSKSTLRECFELLSKGNLIWGNHFFDITLETLSRLCKNRISSLARFSPAWELKFPSLLTLMLFDKFFFSSSRNKRESDSFPFNPTDGFFDGDFASNMVSRNRQDWVLIFNIRFSCLASGSSCSEVSIAREVSGEVY